MRRKFSEQLSTTSYVPLLMRIPLGLDHFNRWRRRARFPLLALCFIAFSIRAGLVLESWGEPPAGDERYGIENMAAIHLTRAYNPKSFWYGGLSYLPQLVLLEAVDALAPTPRLRTLTATGEPTALGFALCLLLQALYGVASIALAARIARRFLGHRGALVTAAVLAAMPQHLHASVTFKPDILLLATTLWAIERSLAALGDLAQRSDGAGREGVRGFGLAGLAVGLAMSTKFNGAASAAPLVFGSVASFVRRPRTLALALLAGAVALISYALINPHLSRQLRWLDRGIDHYSEVVGDERAAAVRTGGAPDEDEPTVAGNAFRMLALLGEPKYLGPTLGTAAAILAALLLARALRGAARRPRRMRTAWRLLALLAFPVAYLTGWALATERVKANHLLELAPLAAMALASFLGWFGGAATTAWVARLRRVVVGLAVTAAILFQVGWLWREWTPTTHAVAIEELALQFVERKEAVWVHTDVPIEPSTGRRARLAFTHQAPAATDRRERPVGTTSRAFAPDVEIFPAEWLRGPKASLYAARVAAADEVIEIHAKRRRGPPLVVLHYRWSAFAVETIGELRRLRRLKSTGTDGVEGVEWKVGPTATPISIQLRRMPRGAQLWWNGEPLESRSWRDRDPKYRLVMSARFDASLGGVLRVSPWNPDALLEVVHWAREPGPP